MCHFRNLIFCNQKLHINMRKHRGGCIFPICPLLHCDVSAGMRVHQQLQIVAPWGTWPIRSLLGEHRGTSFSSGVCARCGGGQPGCALAVTCPLAHSIVVVGLSCVIGRNVLTSAHEALSPIAMRTLTSNECMCDTHVRSNATMS